MAVAVAVILGSTILAIWAPAPASALTDGVATIGSSVAVDEDDGRMLEMEVNAGGSTSVDPLAMGESSTLNAAAADTSWLAASSPSSSSASSDGDGELDAATGDPVTADGDESARGVAVSDGDINEEEDSVSESQEMNGCRTQQTCGACLTASPECGWCTEEGFGEARDRARCDKTENLRIYGCHDEKIVSPKNKIISLTNSEFGGEDEDEMRHLRPQKMSVKLRPGQPFRFSVEVLQAPNPPVDIYYLLDMSHFMQYVELGDALASKMSFMKDGVRLGFGAFIDKKTMPYIYLARMDDPCVGCHAPYGFRHAGRLTNNLDVFKDMVNHTAKLSMGADHPEGGFDAIMQALVCDEEIGWRPLSRKMLVYMSDESFHVAGDGKLGGIVEPNDGACHLEDGWYTESLNQDYPSIGQVAYTVAEKRVDILFAVNRSIEPTYSALSEFIMGSSTAIQVDGLSNLLDLVKDKYQNMTSVIEMRVEGLDASDFDVRFKSACLGSEMKDVFRCDGIRIGQNVTFEVEIEARGCERSRESRQKKLRMYAMGLRDRLELNVELICECGCERSGPEVNASRCSEGGSYECGRCLCNDGFHGRTCEYAHDDTINVNVTDVIVTDDQCHHANVTDNEGHRVNVTDNQRHRDNVTDNERHQVNVRNNDGHRVNVTDNEGHRVNVTDNQRHHVDVTADDVICKMNGSREICEERGQSEKCKCDSIPPDGEITPHSDDFSCDFHDNEMCGGHGVCSCGVCQCDRDLTGQCRATNGICPGRCEQSKPCVQCRAFHSGPYSNEFCAANCDFVEIVDEIIVDREGQKMCWFEDEEDEDCVFRFSYKYDDGSVQVQRKKDCAEPVNVQVWVLAVAAGVVLIGLVLLLFWKVVTTIQDRREFARFEQDRKTTKWEEASVNPIFRAAVYTFQNPIYVGRRVAVLQSVQHVSR